MRIASVLSVLLTIVTCAAGDWPTLHKDYQRSGYTDEVVSGPYDRKWFRDFHDEMIATRVEAIVAEGKAFIPTLAGKLRALDVKTGETLWTFEADGPIGASPCYHDGKVYFGADEGFNRGGLYCVNASDGQETWRYEAGAGVWASPACDGKKVYVGDRAGVLHAVDANTGEKAWTFQTGYMILKPVSFSPDGQRILLGSDDMHLYCLSPAGEKLWTSPKLSGLSQRDQGPTIWQGLVIVRTNPADRFHLVLGRNGDLIERIQRGIPLGDGDEVLLDKWSDYIVKPTPARRQAEQKGVLDYLKANRNDQCFYAFDLKDGSRPWVAQVLFTVGLHNVPTPPTFNPTTGVLYSLNRSAMTYYLRGVRRYNVLTRIDRKTGHADWYWPNDAQKHKDWYGFPMIGDETQALSMMGDMLIGNHQGVLWGLDLKKEKTVKIWEGRDSYGGIYGPGTLPGKFEGGRAKAREGYLTGMPNEWHGPDRSIVAISDGRMFWVVGSQVVCLAGPDVPATPTGGDKALALIKMRLPAVVGVGNVATRSLTGEAGGVVRKTITVEEVRSIVQGLPPVKIATAGAKLSDVQQRLEAQVSELVSDQWAPLMVELGISGEERLFWRTGETIEALSLALPYLPDDLRVKAIKYLDVMAAGGCPMKSPVHKLPRASRREPYDLGPGMLKAAGSMPRYQAAPGDLYALWAYAHYADRWNEIETQLPAAKAIVAGLAGKDVPKDAEQLNAQIAGLVGYARIMGKLGEQVEVDKALKLLAQAATDRVHLERADHALIGGAGVQHSAKVSRYCALTPELMSLLHAYAADALSEHVNDLRIGLPLWYHAYGERMIGGENYISPASLSRGMFLAMAYGDLAKPDELVTFLDQPWGKADLYYIEKLSATLRAGTAGK